MAGQPKVSVIMGIYNCEDTLSEAIESILGQTYTNWELIMCDDGSSDHTYAVAKKYQQEYPDRIILLQNSNNMKLPYTLNRCLSAATGEMIARMDGDDRSHPDRFSIQVTYLLDHPDIQLVGCDMQRFDEWGFHGIMHSVESPNKMTMRGEKVPFFHATIMTYKYVFDTLGGYTIADRTQRGQDVDLWFKFFAHGYNGANLDEVLYNVREDNSAIRRRTAKARYYTFLTIVNGYRMLDFPRIWLIKPAILMVCKSLVPFSVITWLRQRRGYMGEGT